MRRARSYPCGIVEVGPRDEGAGMARLTTHTDSELSARIAADCDAVVAAELDRLRRRLPSLSTADLAAVDDALARLADRLLLDAIRQRPTLHGRVEPIFAPLDSRGRARS